MPYVPHTEEDRKAMLETIGAASIDELFREIPANLRIDAAKLDLASALDEDKLLTHLTELSHKNLDLARMTCFLGAGIYDRYIPASVGAVISRGEFLTAYTPYQPELSQGSLQTIYEFQTMIAEIFGCDLANASMYDGATSMAEAAVLAHGVKGREKIAVSAAIHPHYRAVLKTYCRPIGLEVVELTADSGVTQVDEVTEEAACLIVGYPNFFGVIEDLEAARAAADKAGALLIVVADPVACALLKPPGQYGADVVVGEGQSLGVAMGLGGPVVGLFACKTEHVRRIPGRIVGRTKEAHGERGGYVMTLRTREQDIRREKATSNICTNEALMALANTVYLEALGKNGLRQVATNSVRNTQYAMKALELAGGEPVFLWRVFDEFVLRLPGKDATAIRDRLIEKGILAGLPLGPYYATMKDCLLVAVTERRTKAEIDAYAAALSEVLS